MIETNLVGRPTKLNNTTVQKLIDGFRLGMNVVQACSHADISRSSFYTYLQNDQDFFDKIEYEKAYLLLKSRSIVLDALENNDLKTARWYMEKYDKPTDDIQLAIHCERPEPSLTTSEKIERLETVLRAYKEEGEFATIEIDPEANVA